MSSSPEGAAGGSTLIFPWLTVVWCGSLMTACMTAGPGQSEITRRALLARALTFGSVALTLATGTSTAQQQGTPQEPGLPASPARALPEPKAGGTLRVGKPEDIILAGAPHLLTTGNFPLYNLVYDTLLVYDQQLNPQPRLATTWVWSPNFRELTLQLRPGVTFHTGRPFTSNDAKFNLERLRDPAVGSQWLNYAQLMRVEAPAPDTLVISYDAPARSSFDTLALTFLADPQTLDQTAVGQQFVGTGPFRFQEWVPGDHLTVLRNPAYWQPGKPHLDRVELHVLPDPQAALVTLEAGGVDWLRGVPGQDARRLQADAAYQVLLTGVGGTFYYVGLDVNAPPLADRRVRQAFGYALNRQRLVDTALFGLGRPASIPWPEQSLAYDAALDQTYTYDPARARQLLDAAAWEPGTVVPLSVPNGVAVSVQMAEILQADLAGIGVQLAVQKLNQPDFVARLQKGQFGGAWIVSMGLMNLNPATFFKTAFPVRVPNASNFVSQRYQQLIDQAFAATDDHQLQMSLRELTQILLDEAFVVLIAEGSGQETGPEAARATVRNVTWDRFGGFAYQDVWLDQQSSP
jgi:peptide/nickel transport system substrate-binding protein